MEAANKKHGKPAKLIIRNPGRPAKPERPQCFTAEGNLGLARYLARAYAEMGGRKLAGPVEDSEEYGDAMFGLIEASRRFDPTRQYTNAKGEVKNIRFATYATYWIRRFIQEGQVQRGLLFMKGRRMKYQEVMFTDIDHLVGGGDENAAYIDELIAVVMGEDLDEPEVETPMQRIWLLLERIQERRRRVVFKRHVLGLSLQVVGDQERPTISKERIRQLETRGIEDLQAHIALKPPGGWSLSKQLHNCQLRAAEYLLLYGDTRAKALGREIVAADKINDVLRHPWFLRKRGVVSLEPDGILMAAPGEAS